MQVKQVRQARIVQERLRKRSEAQDLASIKADLQSEKVAPASYCIDRSINNMSQRDQCNSHLCRLSIACKHFCSLVFAA